MDFQLQPAGAVRFRDAEPLDGHLRDLYFRVQPTGRGAGPVRWSGASETPA